MRIRLAIIFLVILGMGSSEIAAAPPEPYEAAKTAAGCIDRKSDHCTEFREYMYYLANFPNPRYAALGLAFQSQERAFKRVVQMSLEEREYDFSMRFLAHFPNPRYAAQGKAYIQMTDGY